MKKCLALAVMAVVLSSCSNDDNNTTKEFFNLKEGNMWVYKQYRSDNYGNNPVFDNSTDTVRVVGKVEVNGKEYFQIHSSYHGDDEYWRVDELNHLVNLSGNVIHPGKDKLYTYADTRDYGVVNYKSEPFRDVVIEGKNYLVHPYVGDLVPSTENNFPEGRGIVIEYQQGVGIVMRRDRYVVFLGYKEDRLVSYNLK